MVADVAATYPEVARSLLERCAEYRQQVIDLAALKATVWAAANEIVIPQERETHDFLQRAEGRLDMVEFTVDDEQSFPATIEIVREIEERLTRYLDGNAAW